MVRIGVDLGGTKIEAIVIRADGVIEARLRRATPRLDYEATVAAVAGVVEDLDRSVGRRCPVGVGTPGAMDPATGLMKNCNSTWLNGRPLLRDLVARLGERVRLANDADCFALSESVDGEAKNARIAFGVILGTGVGGGIVIDGKLLRGRNGIAGEWGHTPLPYLRTDPHADRALEGRLVDRHCYCGRDNCVETFLSGPGLAATHTALWDETREPRLIASAKDPRSERTLELFHRQLARALAQVMNIIDPDVIVLGGGLSEIESIYRRVPELWCDYVFSDKVATRLRPAMHGAAGGVRGAAWLWSADETINSTR